MRFKVTLSSRAQADIESIHAYIARDSLANADRMRGRFIRAAKSLRTMPHRYPVALELCAAGRELRQVTVWPYRIIYEVLESDVLVHAVRHGARLPAEDL